MNNCITTLFLLLFLLVPLPAPAAAIGPNDPTAILELLGLAPHDKRLVIATLFDFSPFSATNTSVVPGLSDPLGAGVDPGLRIFGGTVHYMDLLGNFKATKTPGEEEIELPPNALSGINLLDNFIAVYLAYNGRAFDQSIWNLRTTEVEDRDGLPVTSETSPLSIAGYGSVADHLQPYLKPWTHCAAREKRYVAMLDAKRRGGWVCTVPAVCECYSS